MVNMHDDVLCLPSWHHGKRRKLSWKSHGILLSEFCVNMVVAMNFLHMKIYIWPINVCCLSVVDADLREDPHGQDHHP